MILKNGKRIDGCTDTLPVGTVQPFLGLTPPLGYLVCQGQLISKVEYPELYKICGSTFGAETNTHFYLPDLRGKTIAGYDSNNASMNSIGKILGEEKHNHLTPLSWYANNDKYYLGATNFYGSKKVDYGDLYGNEVTVRGSYPSTSTNRLNYYTDYQSNYQPTITMNWIVKAAMLIPEYFVVENTLTSTSTSNALSAAQGKILNEKIENYSSFRTTETIVGYADNNEAVYRKLIEITTPSEVGVDTVIGTLPAEQKGLYTMQGIVLNSAGCGVPFNYYFGAENWGSIWFNYNTKEIWCVVNNRAYANRQGHIIIEYSKR
jgi:hypothetical protein